MSISLSLNYKDLKSSIITLLSANLVPYVIGQPASGKSAVIKSIAEEYNLKLIDLRLSTMEPVDLTGAIKVNDNTASYIPFDVFPLSTDKIPEGYEGWLLFLDELPSAHRQVIAACYKLILDRQIGQYDLHPQCAIVCAGNRISDKAIVNSIGTAMQSRMVTLELEVNHESWRDTVAIPFGYNPKLIAFLEMYPDLMNTFDPNKPDEPFASPRSYEFANAILNSIEDTVTELPKHILACLMGAIGKAAGHRLYMFLKVYENLPAFEEISSRPEIARVPSANEEQWAIITSLMTHPEPEHLLNILRYVSRMPRHMQAYYFAAFKNAHANNLVAMNEVEQAHKAFLITTAKSMI